MSSTSDPIKHAAQESASEEPSAKKAKISDQNEQKNELDANNATTASNNEKINLENNNGSNSGGSGGGTSSSGGGCKLKTPCKTAVNGNKDNKESKPDATADDSEELYNEDDDEDDGGNLDGVFDPKIAKSLELVEEIQSEITNLNEKASEEILKVEQKFNKLRRPHFEKRNEVLKDIPNFWLTSLANHPIIAPMIESAEDEDCLHYMVNLDVEEYEDIKSGYKLKLHFVNNPYIKNEVIVKEFQIVSSEEVLSSSTPIEYKDTPKGQSLKQVVDTSIAQFKRSRRPGQVQQSFFAWLTEPSESGTDEIAEILKDQVWPSPLEFFFASPEEDDYANTESDEDEETDYENMDGDEGAIITEGMVDFSDEELEGEDDDGDDDDDDDEDDEEDVE